MEGFIRFDDKLRGLNGGEIVHCSSAKRVPDCPWHIQIDYFSCCFTMVMSLGCAFTVLLDLCILQY